MASDYKKQKKNRDEESSQIRVIQISFLSAGLAVEVVIGTPLGKTTEVAGVGK